MIGLKDRAKSLVYIAAGVTAISAGTNVFSIPNGLVTGGATGIGTIVMYSTEKLLGFTFPVSLTNIIVNIPLFIIAYKFFGKKYIKRSFAATLLLSLALQLTEFMPKYSGDLMLAAIFGGILTGVGVGFVLNGSAATGGTETAAHILHHINSRLSISNYIFIIDAAVILSGIFVFGAERGMFAIISVFTASKCIDAVTSGASMDKAAFIVSSKYCEIADRIRKSTGREITALNNENGLVKNNCSNTLICVFSQKELAQIKNIIKSVDSFAFIILFDIKDVYGGGFKQL
ncbi:MAG: YitT family protein [Clostridia bacterium]|nr:YitT family protein [Clostridia bacterium]